MRYRVTLIMAGIMAGMGLLPLCTPTLAASAGFTEQKGERLVVDVPNDWQVAPREFLARVEEGQTAAGKVLMLVQGTARGGMPKVIFMERADPGATSERIGDMTDADLKLWCDALRSGLRQRGGAGLDEVNCEKGRTRTGHALITHMTIPTGGRQMRTLTWTIPHGETTLIASIMYPRGEDEKYLPKARTMFESVRFGK